jgi:CheY-like chemotaxis protein
LARKILLADDSVTAQNMGRKILADAGYDVSTVNNGSAALKRITEIKPDLIVLDVYMPGYSGLEVCQRLKDAPETAHIPVLLTVGKLEPFKPEEARRVRADAHIVKPFEASELLTAITRLEDRMVPQQSDGSRFSTSVSGVERFSGEGSGRKSESDGETDSGWKSRLRFPSKKKKEEPEPEPEEATSGATFRDSRKGKSKTGASGVFAVKAPAPAGQEPGLVPDIPRDITPEELDALSALAAKLDGPIPAAENIAPLAEKMGPVEVPSTDTASASAEVVKAEVESPAQAPSDEKKEAETPASVVEAATASAPAPTLAVSESKVEIPVEQVEPAAEAVAVADSAAAEKPPEAPAPLPTVAVSSAQLAQEAAPVDKSDEPMFAAAATAVAPAAEDKIPEQKIEEQRVEEKKIEAKSDEAVAVSAPKTEEAQPNAPAEAVAAKASESKVEEPKPEPKAEESKAGKTEKIEKIEQPVPVQAAAPAQAEAELEEPAPSDEELAEALRLLTPATGHTDSSFSQNTIPSHGTLVAAGQLLAEEAARNAAACPRWIAEPVALSPEEAALSLEAEMFRTFAASATVPATASVSAPITGFSAISAAVENRLAEAGMKAGARAVEAPSDLTVPVSNASCTVMDAIAAEQAKESEEEPAREVASATFADAVGKSEVEAATEQIDEPVSKKTVAVEEASQNSNSDSGGEEAMGKSGKWNQIRTAPAGAAAGTNVVEAAKQGVEEAPKAMAAAASADGSASASSTDANAIASIVDSVMADLRPRIVEEIAKKLAGK